MREPHLKWHPRLCRVCGLWDFDVDAHGPRAKRGSCPCCGFRFDLSDTERGCTIDEWREQWVEQGMCWEGPDRPERFDPVLQMLRGGVDGETLDALGL